MAARTRRIRGIANLVAAVTVSCAVLYASFAGAGPLPALGPAFNPVTGAWTMAADAAISDQTLHLDGLREPVKVIFEKDGTAHVVALTDHDLFLAVGYVHAKFRLFQMDLLRRQGEGRLSEVFGKAALDSDRFELQLGLLRTAQREWNGGLIDSRAREALTAYAQGVNDRISEAESRHQLDAMFTLVGYHPRPWTPIDTLIVKGDMTQTLNFTDTPLVMALLQKSLGPDLTAKWFPVLPPNPQSPYDLGPYPTTSTVAPLGPPEGLPSAAASTAVADIYQRLQSLPAGLVATGGASNNWAVAGFRSASGGALMAGDPHLHLTLPSIWFQLTMDSPGYHVSGVSIPGTPVVLIGHNQHISWSLTDAQNQQTFFYLEHEDANHPGGEYLWNGSWQRYDTASYDIPVLGGPTQHITVRLSVHGPVINERGQTTSVWWGGNVPSQDLDVLMQIDKASNWQDFRQALIRWYSPTHNFVYADDQGNIGLISAGYYPQLKTMGQPWLPMPGTGEYDVVGTIPYDAIPQVYDPPDGIIWSANQRQVTAAYPYYIGTASNFFDPGYRADEIHRVLAQGGGGPIACPAVPCGGGKLTAADMMALQTDTRDFLASEIVPILLGTLPASPERQLLASWDYRMDTDSPAATIWWTFWQTYIAQTFDPWWKAKGVKVARSEVNDALGQYLEAQALAGATTCGPDGCGAAPACLTASCGGLFLAAAFQRSFAATVSALAKRLGPHPATWTWGRVHTRVLENLAQISGLDYGPRPDRGDANTPLAAPDFPSTHGPSWRMVVDWGAGTFQAVYPGGQSENPASTWYSDRADAWFKGNYAPMLTAGQATAGGAKSWTLQP